MGGIEVAEGDFVSVGDDNIDVFEDGVGYWIKDFCENRAAVVHLTQLAAEVFRELFLAPLAEGALAANHR